MIADPTDYGTIVALCDVAECQQPRDGMPVELLLEGEPRLLIRVHPCAGHRPRLYKRVQKEGLEH